MKRKHIYLVTLQVLLCSIILLGCKTTQGEKKKDHIIKNVTDSGQNYEMGRNESEPIGDRPKTSTENAIAKVDNGKGKSSTFDTAEICTYLRDHKGEVIDVTSRADNYIFAHLNFDGDNEVEIKIIQSENGEWSYFILSLDGVETEEFVEDLVDAIYAFSPDGEHILAMIYGNGASYDPVTILYGMTKDGLKEVGRIENYPSNIMTEKAGIIMCDERAYGFPWQTDRVKKKWKLNEEGMLEEIIPDVREFTTLNDVHLLKSLILHKEIGTSSDTFIMNPQVVHFTRASLDFSQVEISNLSGESGWISLDEMEQQGRISDIFEDLLWYD